MSFFGNKDIRRAPSTRTFQDIPRPEVIAETPKQSELKEEIKPVVEEKQVPAVKQEELPQVEEKKIEDEDSNNDSSNGSFVKKFGGDRPEKFTENKNLNNLVYLVRGKDKGKPAWHYVLVEKLKLPMFKKAIGGTMDVSEYGKIIHSGWGEDPPPELVKKIEQEYGG